MNKQKFETVKSEMLIRAEDAVTGVFKKYEVPHGDGQLAARVMEAVLKALYEPNGEMVKSYPMSYGEGMIASSSTPERKKFWRCMIEHLQTEQHLSEVEMLRRRIGELEDEIEAIHMNAAGEDI